jgi:hypothetical protein
MLATDYLTLLLLAVGWAMVQAETIQNGVHERCDAMCDGVGDYSMLISMALDGHLFMLDTDGQGRALYLDSGTWGYRDGLTLL